MPIKKNFLMQPDSHCLLQTKKGISKVNTSFQTIFPASFSMSSLQTPYAAMPICRTLLN